MPTLYYTTPEDHGGQANNPGFDNAPAIAAAEAAIIAAGGGALRFREGADYYFANTLVGARNRLVWAGERARLIYNGPGDRDLVVFGNGTNQFREMDVSGLEVCSLTVMNVNTCAVRATLVCRSDFTFENIQGQDFAEANGVNIHHGFYADQVDNVRLTANAVNATGDAIRVRGQPKGPQADFFVNVGKISNAAVGLRVGGAFGGLYLTPNTTFIENDTNLRIDQTLAQVNPQYPNEPLSNREVFATGTIFDVTRTGSTGSIVVQDGPVLIDFSNCWIASGSGHGVRVIQHSGRLILDGCRVFNFLQANTCGILVEDAASQVNIVGGQIHNCVGTGLKVTPANHRVSWTGVQIRDNGVNVDTQEPDPSYAGNSSAFGIEGQPSMRYKVISGTLDVNGNGYAAHGIFNLPARITMASGYWKGNSGEAVGMTVSCDGGSIGFSVGAGAAGRSYRVAFWYTEAHQAW